MLSVPLANDMPDEFKISLGAGPSNLSYSIRDWHVMYSNDRNFWVECPEMLVFANEESYKYYTFSVKHGELFKRGKMLYIKIVGASNFAPNGNTADGQGGSGAIRLHSCFAIYDPVVSIAQTPSDAVYYEGFNSMSGGVDYFYGSDRKRLASLSNYCGSKVSLSGYENCYARPGYLQIGYAETQKNRGAITNDETGSFTTPAFGQSGDLALTFKAAAYRNPAAGRELGTKYDIGTPDNTSIQIEVIGGGTIDGETTVLIENVNTEAWQTVTKTIAGATAETQIKFTSPSGSEYNRWFLDDILVK
jgi:hypothetical protein